MPAAAPAPPTLRSCGLPACPGTLPRQHLGRRSHFRNPGASALPVRSPPRAPCSGRPEPRTRGQRGCGPKEAGVVPGRPSQTPFPPRQPVGPRSGHTRKWRGTASSAARPGARRWSSREPRSAQWRVWLRGGGAAAAGRTPARLLWPEIRLRSGSRAPQGPAGLR